MGIYQEEQEAVYQNIMEVVGNDRDPVSYAFQRGDKRVSDRFILFFPNQTFEDYPALYKVLAAFYESLRLIRKLASLTLKPRLYSVTTHMRFLLITCNVSFLAAGSVMIRQTTKDTVLTVPNALDKEGSQQLPLKKDSIVIVDMIGIRA